MRPILFDAARADLFAGINSLPANLIHAQIRKRNAYASNGDWNDDHRHANGSKYSEAACNFCRFARGALSRTVSSTGRQRAFRAFPRLGIDGLGEQNLRVIPESS
jgi:hypothetical protein